VKRQYRGKMGSGCSLGREMPASDRQPSSPRVTVTRNNSRDGMMRWGLLKCPHYVNGS
jgi:hypothetical protein